MKIFINDLSSDLYSINNSNPTSKIEIEKMITDKKIFGFAIEKQSQDMIALAPQMYTAFNDYSIVDLKRKGLALSKLNSITIIAFMY
jgi:hypothetical protein